MPYLLLQDQQFPLPAGEATIGACEGADVRLVAGDASGRAVIALGGNRVVIRRGAPDAVVPDLRFGGINMTFRPAVAKQPTTRAPEAKQAASGAVIACIVSVGGAGIDRLALLLTTLG